MDPATFGNLPGRSAFWSSPDGRTTIIRHCDAVFTLEYDAHEVMPPGSFVSITAYAWSEFITDL